MTRRMYAGGTQPTTLTAPITNSDTSLTVASGTNYPNGGTGKAVLTLDAGQAGEEKVLYTARSGNTFTGLTRGYDGTTASSHAAGASVRHTISAVDMDEANAHVNALGSTDPHPGYVLDAELAAAIAAVIAGLPSPISLPLTQAQSHASPDTDAATTSLHHTLGSGATQAAAGNHTHGGGGGAAANPAFLGLDTPELMGSASQTLGTNVAVYMKFKPVADITVTTLKTYLTAAAGNIDVGIYTDSGGAPNTRLASTGSVAATTTALLSKTITSTALTAGTAYWLAMATSSTGTNFPGQVYVAAALADAVRVQAIFPLPATAASITNTLTTLPPLYIVT